MRPVVGDIVQRESKLMGIKLSSAELDSFEQFAEELKKWNSKVNLTSITKDDEIAIKHFVDCLHAASYLHADDVLLDIGSGAGFPVLPLKIVNPLLEMVSVDTVSKKIVFQQHIVRQFNLQHIKTLSARIEDLHETYRNTFSIIISRAFTRLDRFISVAAPLLAEGGSMIAMKGAAVEDEIALSQDTLRQYGLAVTEVKRYRLPLSMGDRMLVIIKSRKAAKPHKISSGRTRLYIRR